MIRWIVAFLLLAAPAVHAADITVLSAGAINSVAKTLIPSTW
jgi:hypothetical protein